MQATETKTNLAVCHKCLTKRPLVMKDDKGRPWCTDCARARLTKAKDPEDTVTFKSKFEKFLQEKQDMPCTVRLVDYHDPRFRDLRDGRIRKIRIVEAGDPENTFTRRFRAYSEFKLQDLGAPSGSVTLAKICWWDPTSEQER